MLYKFACPPYTGATLMFSVSCQFYFSLFYFYFLATLHSMQDLSSLTKDQTHAPCSGSTVS